MENFFLPNGRILWLKENERKIWLADEHRGNKIFLDFVQREGWACLTEEDMWENVPRIAYFNKFLELRGLLLHAAGLVKNGKAYIFPGVSGSGKTTIVRLSPVLTLLSDEISAIRLNGENGSPVIGLGTPFYGEWGLPGENVAAPVKGLYFLKKAEEHRLTPLTSIEALNRLLPCIFTFTNMERRLKQVIDYAIELVSRVPAFALEFRPNPDFWPVIDGS
jgi:hypothetical protein